MDRRALFATLGLCVWSACAAPSPARPTAPADATNVGSGEAAAKLVRGEWATTWDAYLERAVPFGFAGGVLAVDGAEVVLRGGYGLADRAAGAPATGDTVFYIGSLTKQFTAAAIMKLAEQGKLSPVDPISRFFAAVPADKRAITLHQLLTHTSGLPQSVNDVYGPPVTRDAQVSAVLAAPLAGEPGREHLYSNPGYSLLAVIVELASGADYEQFVHDQLLRPAGMARTGYVLPNWDGLVVAHGYKDGQDLGSPRERAFWAPRGPSWAIRGAGGMLSTLDDLHRWHTALQGDKILSAASRQRMFDKHVETAEDTWYGYGWAVREAGGVRVVSHNGSDGVFYAVLRQWPGHLLIGWTNQSLATYHALDATLARGAVGRRAPKQLPPPVATTRLAITGWVGDYALADGSSVAIRDEPEGLVLEPTGQTALSAVAGAPQRAVALYEPQNRAAEAFLASLSGAIRAPKPGDTSFAARMAAAIRASTTDLGELVAHDVVGTLPRPDGGSVRTYGRFTFAGGVHLVELEWKDATVTGASLGVAHPARMVVRPSSATELVGYSFGHETTLRLRAANGEQPTGDLVIEGWHAAIAAKRRAG